MDIMDFESEEEYIAQMYEGKLLNPRIDSTFKALFTQPTPESQTALKAFLEAATNRKITTVELQPSSAKIDFFGQRGIDFDILCKFDDGEQANIEMQAFKQHYDYGKRAEYYVAKIFASAMKKGDSWQKTTKAYQISVLDFVNDATSNEIVSRYAMRTKEGRELKSMQNIIFIELPKVREKENCVSSNTSLENWAIFLKDVDNPQKAELINTLTSKEAGLMQAQQSLSSISENRELWLTQLRQEIAERDYISNYIGIREEGLAEGRAEGLVKGRAEGEAQRAIRLGKKYMAAGHTAEEAAEFAEIDIKFLQE